MQIQLDILIHTDMDPSGRARLRALSLLILIFFALAAAGCARQVPSRDLRLTMARTLAGQELEPVRFDSQPFELFGYAALTDACQGQNIHVYIEGDGLAWLTPSTVSEDPTPLTPTGLKLAAKDPHACRVYLARPCQYISGKGCGKAVWTRRRFSNEVIQSYHQVLDQMAGEVHPSSFTVVGYSGGGAVAAILAARRPDVSTLVTVAGNLDTDFWTRSRGISPLKEALNPADFAETLEKKRQYHFIGGRDRIVGQDVFLSFARKVGAKNNFHYKIIDGFDHSCCWEEAWPALLKEIGEQ